jgi:hypothetical protein
MAQTEGANNAVSSKSGLALEVFASTIARFAEVNVFKELMTSQTISGGYSGRFDVRGGGTSNNIRQHALGEAPTNTGLNLNKRNIEIERNFYDRKFIDNLERKKIHFSLIEVAVEENADSMAEFVDEKILEQIDASMDAGQLFADGAVAVTAGSFVVGKEYVILTVGDTDYTAIGASSNTVGVIFKATGVGAGTGTAHEKGQLVQDTASVVTKDAISTGATTEAQGDAILEAIFEAGSALNRKKQKGKQRYCALTPELYTKLVLSKKALNSDYNDGSNGSIKMGNVLEINGMKIITSNNIETTGLTSQGNGNALDGLVLAGWVFTEDVVGITEYGGIETNQWEEKKDKGFYVDIDYAFGTGTLNPASLVALTYSE